MMVTIDVFVNSTRYAILFLTFKYLEIKGL